MSEMVQRVAEAIAANAYRNPDKIARAVIEAMREPTEEMLSVPGMHCSEAEFAWHTMIDTALEN